MSRSQKAITGWFAVEGNIIVAFVGLGLLQQVLLYRVPGLCSRNIPIICFLAESTRVYVLPLL